MNMDMIKTWLDDFSQWSKILGGLGKVFSNMSEISSARDFLKPKEGADKSGFSSAFDTLSSTLKLSK